MRSKQEWLACFFGIGGVGIQPPLRLKCIWVREILFIMSYSPCMCRYVILFLSVSCEHVKRLEDGVSRPTPGGT